MLNFFLELNIDTQNHRHLNILNRKNSFGTNQIIDSNKNGALENIVETNPNSIIFESPNRNSKLSRDEISKYAKRTSYDELLTEHELEVILKKERSKLIYISKIYQTFLDLNKFPDHLYNEFSKTDLDNPINYGINSSTNKSSSNNKNRKTNFFKLDSIKVNDLKLQIAICTILGLYLIQVINKNICYVLLKFICNKFKLTHNDIYCIRSIKNILGLKTEILLGLYFSLIENLKSSNEFQIINKKKLNKMISGKNIFNEEAEKGSFDLSIQKNTNTASEDKEKNIIENEILSTNNDNQQPTKKDEVLMISDNNPYLRWEEMIKVLELQKLILNITKISQRNNTIYQMIEENKYEDRKKFILLNIIKPLDDLYNLFDEALILVQYLSDFIKMNNFHDILLVEYTKDYRYFLETKDVFFQYLNHKSKKNIIYDSRTDRIFIKHMQSYLGNSIFFKLKEKRIEEKIAEHQNNLSLKTYFQDVSNENINETKKFYNTMTNFNKSKLPSDRDIKIKSSYEKTNSKIIQNNLNKFNKLHKFKENLKINNILNYPQNFISKKHFYSNIKKNDEKKKENIEKMKEQEEKNEIAKKVNLKDKDLKPLLGSINRQRNNRNEVEKEQTILIPKIRCKDSYNIGLANSERKGKYNDAVDVYSRSFDKIYDISQDIIIMEKNLNISQIKNEYFYITQENEAYPNHPNHSNHYKSNNFLLTQIANNENLNLKSALNENLSENEYKLIPKKEFNKKNNFFFQNELYKVKTTKINNNQEYKNVHEIDEVSDFLKTMKLKIGTKPSSSLNLYKRESHIDINNENNKHNSNLISQDEYNIKDFKRFNKTAQDFFPIITNTKSSDNMKIFEESLYKSNNQENLKSFNSIIIINNGNIDQKSQSNQLEFHLSRCESPEKFRENSNDFLMKSVKLMSHEDLIRLNNFRILSPKLNNIEDSQVKNTKCLSSSIKPFKNIGDSVDFINSNLNNMNQTSSKKLVSNFTAFNNKIIKNNDNNLDNFQRQNKPENKQNIINNQKEVFRNSQNCFFNNPNKVVQNRKILKSYDLRRIKCEMENIAKKDKKENNDPVMLGYEKEKEQEKLKKKIVILII